LLCNLGTIRKICGAKPRGKIAKRNRNIER
jgi:hypothetical protein